MNNDKLVHRVWLKEQHHSSVSVFHPFFIYTHTCAFKLHCPVSTSSVNKFFGGGELVSVWAKAKRWWLLLFFLVCWQTWNTFHHPLLCRRHERVWWEHVLVKLTAKISSSCQRFFVVVVVVFSVTFWFICLSVFFFVKWAFSMTDGFNTHWKSTTHILLVWAK